MLDLGHALAAVAVAAHCLGWQASLEDDPGTDDLTTLLGLKDQSRFSQYDSEEEHADVLLAIFITSLPYAGREALGVSF